MTVTVLDPTTQAYGELQAAFEHYNAALFDGQLPHRLITMQREKRTYGYFSSRRFANRHEKTMTDEIAMNPSYLVSCLCSKSCRRSFTKWRTLGSSISASRGGGATITRNGPTKWSPSA